MKEKLYKDRDIEAQQDIYFNHISAMTTEELYSKSAIAAELAHRDIIINKLREANRLLKHACSVYANNVDSIAAEMRKLTEEK